MYVSRVIVKDWTACCSRRGCLALLRLLYSRGVVYRRTMAEVRCLRGVCGGKKWLGGGSRNGGGKETLLW
jgi:hypothetical protein